MRCIAKQRTAGCTALGSRGESPFRAWIFDEGRVKTCFKCKVAKPIEHFYTHKRMADGVLGKCKECAKADVRAKRAEDAERYRELDRNRYALGKKKYYEPTSEQKRARSALHRKIASGVVVPWPVCFVPECDKKPEAHHPDYSAPLSVVWLCRSHHKLAHAITLEEQG